MKGVLLCPPDTAFPHSQLFTALWHVSASVSPLLSRETLYLSACRFPVVAMGVLKWVDWTVSEPRYFQLQTDHTPVHLALLDEVRGEGPLVRYTVICVLDLCVRVVCVLPAFPFKDLVSVDCRCVFIKC